MILYHISLSCTTAQPCLLSFVSRKWEPSTCKMTVWVHWGQTSISHLLESVRIMSLMLLRVSFHLRFTDFKLKVSIALLLKKSNKTAQTKTQTGLMPFSSRNRIDRIPLKSTFRTAPLSPCFATCRRPGFSSLLWVRWLIHPPAQSFCTGVKLPVEEHPFDRQSLYHNRRMIWIQPRC